jgi:hypothetical protein
MLDDYLQVASSQMIERASGLKGKLPRPPRREFERLAVHCCDGIDLAIKELKEVRDNPVWRRPANAAVQLLEFRRIASNIDRFENEAVAAIVRSGKDEGAMVSLLYRMSNEITYPIELPTVSMLSQNYFFIRTDFRLMCIPLMEPYFLLHLPDIYHELAHPLFRTQHDPRTKPWLESFLLAKGLIYDHLTKQSVLAESSRTPEAIKCFLQFSRGNWLCRWMEEIFCDLFGLFSVGPAYAWAHLHLHAERGGNAFQLPHRRSSHPADDPRMTALLEGLLLIGGQQAAGEIEGRWGSLLRVAGQTEPPDFQRYYPDQVLRQCVQAAFDGFTKMGCKPWPGSGDDVVRKVLNDAWRRFWESPEDFVAWEQQAAKTLLSLDPAGVVCG